MSMDWLLDRTVGSGASGKWSIIWLEMNWQKTKFQVLDEPSTIAVQGQEVAVVKKFVYLGSLTHSAIQGTPDITRRNAITGTRTAMQNVDNQGPDFRKIIR